MSDPLVWSLVEWKQGDGTYRFEVARGGLHGTMTAPGGRNFTIPMVAWFGLLDALGAARKTKDRGDRPMPLRSGARWSPTETDEVIANFKAGRSIALLAQAHNRSEYAIESQLAQHRLWDPMHRCPL